MDWTYQELWFIPYWSKRCISSPKCPDLLWDPRSLLFNGNQGIFLCKWSCWTLQPIHC